VSAEQIDSANLISILPMRILTDHTVYVPLLYLLVLSINNSVRCEAVSVVVRVFDRGHLMVLFILKEDCCGSILISLLLTSNREHQRVTTVIKGTISILIFDC